jgi:hypothetical protein
LATDYVFISRFCVFKVFLVAEFYSKHESPQTVNMTLARYMGARLRKGKSDVLVDSRWNGIPALHSLITALRTSVNERREEIEERKKERRKERRRNEGRVSQKESIDCFSLHLKDLHP